MKRQVNSLEGCLISIFKKIQALCIKIGQILIRIANIPAYPTYPPNWMRK